MNEINVTSLSSVFESWNDAHKIQFSWYDYTLFITMLTISVLIGIYFGCFGQGQSTADEYLLGGKKMRVVPIGLSLIASAISGITILAVPADIFEFGATYWYSGLGALLVVMLTYVVYLPVFHKLQVTSSYEYLKLRFNTQTRIFASLLFVINTVLYLPIVIYVPAIAFSHATNIDTHYITPLVCGVCIFYTTIGGLKAVVWTDTVQFSVMIGAMLAVFCLGLIDAGGMGNVWRTSTDGGRLDVDLDISPFKRDTLWAVIIGLSFNWIGYMGLNQGTVQKLMSLPTLKDAKNALIIVCFGMIINKTFSVLTGLMIYTKYNNCDPILTGRIERPDQLLPYFIMDVASQIPGLPGLFTAGLFCAALSTLSAVMNCLTCTIYEDFISGFMPKDVTQKTVSNILKAIVVITGVISTSLVYVIENLGTLFPLAISFGSIASGPMIGLFTLGMLCPSANSKGALFGGISSLGLLSFMMVGAQYYKSKGIIHYSPLPSSVDGCEYYVNTTSTQVYQSLLVEDEPFFLFRITYYYYTLIGTLIVVIVGLFVSWLTKVSNDVPIHKDLISPVMHWLLNQDERESSYYSVPKALNIIEDSEEVSKIQLKCGVI